MEISIYYERKDQVTVLEVADEECEIWIETDYQQRLATAGDRSSVERRTAQQIMDEECNKPTFNRNQAETRRHVLLSSLDPEERFLSGNEDIQSDILTQEDYEELYHAIEGLKPQQKELIRRVFWDEVRQVQIAREQNVTEAAVAGRMDRIYAKLKKLLKT